MMKTLLGIIFLTAVILIPSCEMKGPETAGGTGNALAEAEIMLTVPAEEKLITVWVPGKVASFVYKATPKFVQDEDVFNDITGAQPEWTPVKFYTVTGEEETVGHIRASMGYYQPGEWEIEIMALNRSGNPVYYGTTGSVFLNAGELNGFMLELHGVQSIGSTAALDVTFTGPRVSENVSGSPKPKMVITWLEGNKREISSGWTSTVKTDGTIEHSIHLEGMPAGETEVLLATVMPDGSPVSEERIAVLLVNGETTIIEGTLETGEYTDPSFDIEEDKTEIKASVRIVSGGTERAPDPYDGGERFFDVAKNATAVFSYDLDGAEGQSWKWYVNGIQEGTEKTFRFMKTEPGQYQVTAVTWRNEKTVSEEILVIVM